MSAATAAKSARPTSRPLYERPALLRHQMGLMNKFGRAQAPKPLTHIDGVSVDELVARYGSPLFVFSEQSLVQRYHDLRQAFARRYAKVRIAWSYKTNYLQAICRVFHREGAWAEVVSPMEFDKALHTGVPADHIHFNGPYKPDAAIETAVRGGSPIHLDSFDELHRVERISERMDQGSGAEEAYAPALKLRPRAAPPLFVNTL